MRDEGAIAGRGVDDDRIVPCDHAAVTIEPVLGLQAARRRGVEHGEGLIGLVGAIDHDQLVGGLDRLALQIALPLLHRLLHGSEFRTGHGRARKAKVLRQRRTVPRRLPAVGRLVDRKPHALEGFLDGNVGFFRSGEQRGRIGAVGAGAVFGFRARRGRERHEGIGRADLGIDDRQSAADRFVEFGERIVTAGIEQQEAHLARHRGQRIEDVVDAHRLHRNVGFTLHIDIDRHQKILAVDLQAVTGVKDHRDGIRTPGGDLAGEFADFLPHLVL